LLIEVQLAGPFQIVGPSPTRCLLILSGPSRPVSSSATNRVRSANGCGAGQTHTDTADQIHNEVGRPAGVCTTTSPSKTRACLGQLIHVGGEGPKSVTPIVTVATSRLSSFQSPPGSDVPGNIDLLARTLLSGGIRPALATLLSYDAYPKRAVRTMASTFFRRIVRGSGGARFTLVSIFHSSGAGRRRARVMC
jgi:hypothetical protein